MTLPTVIPTAELPLAMHHLAESLANSATWQTITLSANPEAAKAAIWIRGVPERESQPPVFDRPFALIAVNSGVRRAIAIDEFQPQATLVLMFEFTTNAAYEGDDKMGDAYYDALNKSEAILSEIIEQRNTAGRLSISSSDLQSCMRMADGEETTEGHYWQVMYGIGYDQ